MTVRFAADGSERQLMADYAPLRKRRLSWRARTIIDGKAVAARVRAEVAEEVAAHRERGARPASRRCWSATTRPRRSTSAASTRPAPRSGSRSIRHDLPADTSEDELLDAGRAS